MKKIIIGVLLLATMLLATSCFNYSNGDRVGQIIKFSNKGIIWKTWEGEMGMGALIQTSSSGASPYVFDFSLDNENKYNVDNEQLRADIQICMESGKRCKVHYEQELFIAPWRAKTNYIVTQVTMLNETN